MKVDPDNIYLVLEFQTTASIPADGAEKFITDYHIIIKSAQEEGIPDIVAGEARLIVVLTDLALNYHIDMFEIFDESQSLMELGEVMYDFEHHHLKNELSEHFNHDLVDGNILFMERLELHSEFRGLGIGKRIIKELIDRFSGCTGIIALKAFPLQFETERFIDPAWEKKLALNELEQDEEKATYQLYSCYQKSGFSNPFDDGYFFMNPALKNEKSDQIG